MSELAYLATPYSRYPSGIGDAFIETCKIAAKLLQAGVKFYSPIAHSHGIAVWGHIDPLDLTIWLPFDEAIMKVSDVLIVAQMEGWKESTGVRHEIEFFRRANKPIFYLDPVSMTMSRDARAAESACQSLSP
jgi:hypothetical protein